MRLLLIVGSDCLLVSGVYQGLFVFYPSIYGKALKRWQLSRNETSNSAFLVCKEIFSRFSRLQKLEKISLKTKKAEWGVSFLLFIFYVMASGQTCGIAPRGMVHVAVLSSS